MKKNKIILVVGVPRSGTTLCELLISSHREAIGIGEHFYFVNFHLQKGNKTASDGKKICGCGSMAKDCEVWGSYMKWLKYNEYQVGLTESYKKILSIAKNSNSNVTTLVDSSPGGLNAYFELSKEFEVYVVHISRDLTSYFYSQKTESIFLNIKKLARWIYTNIRIYLSANHERINYIRIGFEELVENPEAILNLIESKTNLVAGFENLTEYLNKPSAIHCLWGNRTRYTFKDGVILKYRLDWLRKRSFLYSFVIICLQPLNNFFVFSNNDRAD